MNATKLLMAVILFVPVAVFGAAEVNTDSAATTSNANADGEHARIINPNIDAWAEGTVSQIDPKTGEVTIHGSELPFATAHAQMRQEMHRKLSGLQDHKQKMAAAKEIRNEWKGKLEAAKAEKHGAEKDFSFNKPAGANDLVVLNENSIRDLPLFQRLSRARAANENVVGEVTIITVYKMPEGAAEESNAEVSQPTAYDRSERTAEVKEKVKERINAVREKLNKERLSVNDLKPGDKVFVGYDKNNNTDYTIVRREPASQETQPATQPAAPQNSR